MEEHGGDGSSEFFKIVFEPVSQGVRLPTLFMQNHGHSLNHNTAVTLTVPTGGSWSVRLRQTDTGMWFDRGWQEFADHYKIEARHFLYFSYQGGARFSIVIFHPSGSEIDYPPKAEDDEEMLPARHAPIDEDKDEHEDEDEEEMPEAAKPAIRGAKKKEFKSYKKAADFRSKNPFFVTFMQPSYVGNRYMASISLSRVWDWLPEDKRKGSCEVQAHVPGSNRVWPLTYIVYPHPHYPNSRKTVITNGWIEFVVENQLCVGDVCVFELVNLPALRFKITIFRNT